MYNLCICLCTCSCRFDKQRKRHKSDPEVPQKTEKFSSRLSETSAPSFFSLQFFLSFQVNDGVLRSEDKWNRSSRCRAPGTFVSAQLLPLSVCFCFLSFLLAVVSRRAKESPRVHRRLFQLPFDRPLPSIRALGRPAGSSRSSILFLFLRGFACFPQVNGSGEKKKRISESLKRLVGRKTRLFLTAVGVYLDSG